VEGQRYKRDARRNICRVLIDLFYLAAVAVFYLWLAWYVVHIRARHREYRDTHLGATNSQGQVLAETGGTGVFTVARPRWEFWMLIIVGVVATGFGWLIWHVTTVAATRLGQPAEATVGIVILVVLTLGGAGCIWAAHIISLFRIDVAGDSLVFTLANRAPSTVKASQIATVEALVSRRGASGLMAKDAAGETLFYCDQFQLNYATMLDWLRTQRPDLPSDNAWPG